MKIAIAGYGVEGRSNYAYWSRKEGAELTIVDEQPLDQAAVPHGVPAISGPDAFQKLDGFDLVIRSAGVAPYKIKTDGKVWSGTNEFFLQCTEEDTAAPNIDIIGVTGSKGKGTTASFIASILKAAGKTVWLVGNIGLPALDVLKNVRPGDIVVYELSSFQLWDIERSPKTAVVLFIEQEHLDVHRDMAEYVAAKGNIARFQAAEDLLVYNAENAYSREIAAHTKAVTVGYPSSHTTHIRDGYFYNGEQKLCPIEAVVLPGKHNLSNAIAAIDAVWQYVQDGAVIEQGLRAFKGLPHRLAFVREANGVRYYDDSIATTPTSAIAALRSFEGKKVIILGGSPKGSDFTELAEELTRHDVHALIMGEEAAKIAAAADAAGFSNYELIDQPTMSGVVARAAEVAEPNSVVLLSPASASFGLFKNYADRGEQFIAAVEQL